MTEVNIWMDELYPYYWITETSCSDIKYKISPDQLEFIKKVGIDFKKAQQILEDAYGKGERPDLYNKMQEKIKEEKETELQKLEDWVLQCKIILDNIAPATEDNPEYVDAKRKWKEADRVFRYKHYVS